MRLINADEVDKQAMYGHILYEDGTENLGYTRIVLGTVIKDAPTIEAEPVRHGHWEWFEEWSESNTEHYAECEDAGWRCSACKKSLADVVGGYWDDMDDIPKLHYCPNCGARCDL